MINDNNSGIFRTGEKLGQTIKDQTSNENGVFVRRDFVESLVKFCLDGNYTARIGIVFGLRSTGKTVGMLQAADDLIKQGHSVAYAGFNYKESEIKLVNDEIRRLAEEGVTHFFLDEASYLKGFMNGCAEWADSLMPDNRIKIVISGTDSFGLWITMGNALYHRYVRFSTNRNSFAEFNRVLGQSYDKYKRAGGVFLTNSEAGSSEYETASKSQQTSVVEQFVHAAVVKNLIHTLENCNESPGNKGYYYDWLYDVNETVIFKAVISILESTVLAAIRKNFIQDAGVRNLPELGEAVSNWIDDDKKEIRELIADSLSVYEDFQKIEQPAGTIDALVAFLTKIGCLAKSSTGMSDLYECRPTLYFAHNVLMNYAVQETINGITRITKINQGQFVSGITQAAEGYINENIVYLHLMLSLKGHEKIFKYHDTDNREIDAVIIDRETKTLRLIEIKSKTTIRTNTVFRNEAKHLCDTVVLKNIGVDKSFKITRVIAYRGETTYAVNKKFSLVIANIENLIRHYSDLSQYLDTLKINAEDLQKKSFFINKDSLCRESKSDLSARSGARPDGAADWEKARLPKNRDER
jgi:predicted AAA+ superfamily ATPase